MPSTDISLSIGDIDKRNRVVETGSIEIDPKLVGSYVLLAHAYSKQGNSELASEAAARAKELGYTGSYPESRGASRHRDALQLRRVIVDVYG